MHCYGNLQTIKVLSHGLKKCSEAKTLKTRAKVLEPDHAQKSKMCSKKQIRAQLSIPRSTTISDLNTKVKSTLTPIKVTT